MNRLLCSPAFRRPHLLAAKQLLRIAIAPAKAGITCCNVRFMGSMREIPLRRSLSPALSSLTKRGREYLLLLQASRCPEHAPCNIGQEHRITEGVVRMPVGRAEDARLAKLICPRDRMLLAISLAL